MYSDLFKAQENITKTLANKKRLEIIHLLRHKELSVNDMVKMLGLRQANLSQHLSVLREEKIVETRREGNKIFYKLSDPRIADAYNLIRGFIKDKFSLNEYVIEALSKKDKDLFPIVVDPVCGMRFSYSDAFSLLSLNGTAYHFCANGCKEKFIKNPKKYIKEKIKESILV